MIEYDSNAAKQLEWRQFLFLQKKNKLVVDQKFEQIYEGTHAARTSARAGADWNE